MDPTWWSTSCDGETSHEPLTYETDIDIDELDLDYFLAESAAGHQEILNRASALPVPRPAKDDLLTRVKTAVKEGEGFKDWKVLLHAVRAFSTKRTESCLQNYVRADCKLDIASDRRLIFLHEGAKKDCIAEFADLYNIVTHEDIQRICQCKPIYLEELRTATQQTGDKIEGADVSHNLDMATTLVNMRILESRLNNVVTAMKDLLDTGDCLWPHRLLLSTINLGVVTGFRTFLKSKTGSASRARNPGNSSGPGGSASGEGGERGNGPHNGAPGGPHQPDSNPNAHSFQLPPSDGAWLPDRTRTTGSACDTSTCTKEGADIDVQSSPGESTPVEDRDFTTEVGGGGEGQCEIGARAVEEEGVGDNSALLEGPGMPVADVSADEGETSEAETEKASPVPEDLPARSEKLGDGSPSRRKSTKPKEWDTPFEDKASGNQPQVSLTRKFSTIEESATERKHTRTRLQVERPNEVADGREGKKSETETEKPSPVLEELPDSSQRPRGGSSSRQRDSKKPRDSNRPSKSKDSGASESKDSGVKSEYFPVSRLPVKQKLNFREYVEGLGYKYRGPQAERKGSSREAFEDLMDGTLHDYNSAIDKADKRDGKKYLRADAYKEES